MNGMETLSLIAGMLVVGMVLTILYGIVSTIYEAGKNHIKMYPDSRMFDFIWVPTEKYYGITVFYWAIDLDLE